MTDVDIAYIAGVIDGEGYIGIKKDRCYKCQERKTPGYHARIQIRMVNEGAIYFIANTLGGWYYKEKPSAKRGKPLYCYQASDLRAEKIINTVFPFLRVKKNQASTVIAFRNLQNNGKKHIKKIIGQRPFLDRNGKIRMVPNKCFSDEYVNKCNEYWLKCKELNRAGV